MIRADPVEQLLLARVVERAAAYREKLDLRLARMIISEYADLRRRSRR